MGVAAATVSAQTPTGARPVLAEALVELCHLEIIEMLADDLGPDIYTVPWLGDVTEGTEVDANVTLETCLGGCLAAVVVSNMDCPLPIPIAQKRNI